MNKKSFVIGAALVAVVFSSSFSAKAEGGSVRKTPFMLSLVDPLALPSSAWADWDVTGIRLNTLYGNCRSLTGLDIGLYNSCSQLKGWQIGVINEATVMKGLQTGLINYANSAMGVQIGLVNVIADKDWAFLPIVNASF